MKNRRTPAGDPRELTARWSALHHGLEPADFPLVRGWLRLMWAGGRMLARAGVPPTAVTASGVALAGGSIALARRHPVPAGMAVIAAACCDGLDGATAVVGDSATRSGARADAVADRLCDAAFAVVVWRRGAPAWTTAVTIGLAWGVDTLRRVRRIPDRVTVAERPTFTVCTALACCSAPFTRGGWPARLSALVWSAAGCVGIVQLQRSPSGGADLGRHRAG